MKRSFQAFCTKYAVSLAPLVLAVASSATAVAATYYVSPAGSDTNDGLSPNTPWRTVGKVNGSQFQPGDQVLFQRGGQWRESLIAPSSGAAGNPITFADYGSGAKPKFWGSIILDNSQFTPVGNGVYAYNSATPIYSVLANQTFFNYSNGQFAGAVANSWSYNGQQLFLNSPGADPRTDGLLYTGVVRDDVVYSNAQNHLVFQNLVVDESARYDDNGGYGFRVMNSTDVQLLGDEAYHAGKHNFGVINSTAFVGRDLAAAYAAPGQNGLGGASAYVSYGDSSTGLLSQTSEWHNISATNMDDPQEGTVYQAFLNHGATITSLWVDGLQSSNASVNLSNSDNPSAATRMTGGTLQNTRLELDGNGLLVDGTRLVGPQASIDMTSSNTTLQNVVIAGTNLNGAWYQTALLNRGVNNTLRFSTIYTDPNSGWQSGVAILNPLANFNLYGNAIITPQNSLALWSLGLGFGTFGQSGSNFYAQGTNFLSFLGLSFNWHGLPLMAWQAQGFDNSSLQGNPLFADPANGNFEPAAGSPLIDAAHLPSSLVSSVPTDAAGNPRLQGAAFDIGAFESTGAAVVIQAVATTTTLSLNNNTLTAQVTSNSGSGAPTGSVAFLDGNTTLGTANIVNGSASYGVSLDSTVAHTLTAVYSGNANFLTSTSAPINVSVVPVTPPTTPTVPTTPTTPTTPTVPTPTAPVAGPVIILTPTANQTVSGVLTISAAITVNLDAAGAHLVLDGQQLLDHRLTNAPYVFTLDTTQLTPGAHTLQIWAHDINNNVSLSNPVGINVAQ